MTTTAPEPTFAGVIAALHELNETHPEAAGPLAVELGAIIDAIQHDADEYAERVVDEP